MGSLWVGGHELQLITVEVLSNSYGKYIYFTGSQLLNCRAERLNPTIAGSICYD